MSVKKTGCVDPKFLQAGNGGTSVSVAAGGVTSSDVKFPVKFDSPPIVVATTQGSGYGAVSIQNVTENGFTANVRSIYGSSASMGPFRWIAIDPSYIHKHAFGGGGNRKPLPAAARNETGWAA